MSALQFIQMHGGNALAIIGLALVIFLAFSTEFSTTLFERSHGKKPRGYGGWVFIVMDGDTEHETVFVPGSSSLANAKTWMRSYCRTNYSDLPAGFVEVQVAP